mgnify:CR=1 FL=1
MPLSGRGRVRAREESGIPIALDGILRLEHTPLAAGAARVRAIFLAHPADDTPPQSIADEESLEAAWAPLGELERYSWRGEEVRRLFTAVAEGLPVASLSWLGVELALTVGR